MRSTEGYEVLASFSQHLIQTLLKTGLYDPQHPSSKQALLGMYQAFRIAMAEHSEVTYIAIRRAEGADVFVEGYFDTAIPLTEVMRVGAASLFVPKFLAYFERHKLYSLTLSARMEQEELAAFVQTMLEQMATGATPEQVRRALLVRQVEHLTLLFAEDAVGATRRISWRAEQALTRLVADLRRLRKRTDLSPIEQTQRQPLLAEDVLRPIRSGDLLSELLVNLDLVEAEMHEVGVQNPVALVTTAIIPAARMDTIGGLRHLRERVAAEGQPRARERLDLAEACTLMIREVGLAMSQSTAPEEYEFIESLVTDGVLSLNDLSPSLRQDLAARVAAHEILNDREAHLEMLGTVSAPAMLRAQLDQFPRMAPFLIDKGQAVFLCQMLQVLWQRNRNPDTAPELKEIIGTALKSFLTAEVLAATRVRFAEAKKEERVELIRFLRVFGQHGAEAMLGLLHTTKDRFARKSLIEGLVALGPHTESLLIREVEREGQPWFVSRNVLNVLARVGTERSGESVQKMLRHPKEQVRVAAIETAMRVFGAKAEFWIAPLLRDRSDHVRGAAVEQLGRLRSTHPELLACYQAIFDPAQTAQWTDALRKTACLALGRTGNVSFGGGLDAEILLCRALLPRQRKVLGIRVRDKSPFSPTIRRLICDLLGQIGGASAREVLEDVTDDPDTGVAAQAQKALRELEGRLGEAGD